MLYSAILAIALIVVGWFLLRTRESNARLAEVSRRSEEEAAEAKQERDSLREFGESLKQVEQAVTRQDARGCARCQGGARYLAGVAQKSDRVVERVDGLVGRWANPKQRGQRRGMAGAALRQMALRDGVHFEVQKRVAIDAARGQKDGVTDITSCSELAGRRTRREVPLGSMLDILDDETDARDFALASFALTRFLDIKDVGGREYRGARDLSVRHAPCRPATSQTLELQ